MKLAYIISAYKYPSQLVRLVNRLHTPKSIFLIHVDKRTDATKHREMVSGLNHLRNVIFLKRHRCHWGDFGHVRATLKGLSYLFEKDVDFDYLFLLTGQDYPIKSTSYIQSFLSKANEKDFIEYEPFPIKTWTAHDGGFAMIEYWHFRIFGKHLWFPQQLKSNSKIKVTVYLAANMIFPKRTMPGNLTPFGGSSYWCITKRCAKMVNTFVEQNPDFVRFFRYVDIPDESIFQTIILNSRLSQNTINGNLRCIDWSDPVSKPHIWRKEDFQILAQSTALIARKFDATVDSEIFDLIDSKLL